MAKWWSLLFGVTMLVCAASMAAAPFIPGWWLPMGVSTHAGDVDSLYYFILFTTTFFFLLTEALLVWFMYEYGSRAEKAAAGVTTTQPTVTEKLAAQVQKVIKTEQQLELAWTIVPAAILLYVAFAQIGAWANVKYTSRMPRIDDKNLPLQIDVSARQFEWRFRYPSAQRYGEWKKNPKLAEDFSRKPHFDDVHIVNELHVFTTKGATKTEEFPAVLAHVKTIDVIHNFNLPHFRVKQDTLPGKIIPVWFRPTKANTKKLGENGPWVDGINPETGQADPLYIWEVACAELCGWGHYRMIARVYVHPNEEDFLAWLRWAEQQQNVHQREKTSK